MNKTMPALLALLAALMAGPAAAVMYRCGNAFQDRPCEDSSQQQTIKPGRGAASPAPAASRPARKPASPAAADPAPVPRPAASS